MRNVNLIIAVACILFFATPTMSHADVPQMINYQGRLTDSEGGPVKDSNYAVTFRIYNQAEGGEIIWDEEDTVSTQNGLFSLILGQNNPMHDSVFNESTRYLGIQLEGQGEIYPRTALISVPYAFHASRSDTADYAISGIESGWIDDGSVVRLKDGIDSVGIGTAEPLARLHVYDSTDNFAIPQPLLTLHAHSTGSYIEGFGPQITFRADDNGGNDFEWGRISAVKDFFENNFARFEWSVLGNGVMSSFMTLGTQGGLAVNNPNNCARDRGLFEVRNYAANRCVAGFGSDISENNVYIDYTGDPGNNPEASFLTLRTHTDSIPVTKFKFLANGNLGIGITSPGTKLAVYGLTGTSSYNNIKVNTATGDFYYESSSERYKENIQLFEEDFSKIYMAEPKTFIDKSSGIREIGYIAEEFHELGLSDLVIYDSDGNPNSLKYDRISLYLLEIMRERDAHIAELTVKISLMEKQLIQLLEEEN